MTFGPSSLEIQEAEDKAISFVRLIALMRDEDAPEIEREAAGVQATALVEGLDLRGSEGLIFTHYLGICVLLLSEATTSAMGNELTFADYMEILREHARARHDQT